MLFNPTVTLQLARIKLLLPFIAWLSATACDAQSPKPANPPREVAPGVLQVGRITNPRITESSGIVASRQYPGVFWTHTDGGGGKKQLLFAINREGQTSGEFFVAGASISDWEDIAIDDQHHLFVGDIGNNNAAKTQIAVHQINEPDPKSRTPSAKITRTWQLRFPGAPFDCESLFIWQTNGYVISKVFDGERAHIYRFPLDDQKQPFTLEFVTRLKIETPVTGADLSADGRQLGLVGHTGAFVYDIGGNINRAGRLKPAYTKFSHQHIEGCCFVPDGLLVTSEARGVYLFTNAPFLPLK